MAGNIFFENLERWKSHTNIDYFPHFMKAWLVFNAWMYNTTGLERDRDNINHVKDHHNSFKNHLLNLIEITNSESDLFKSHIGNLHFALQYARLQNKGELLTFENAYIGTNPNRQSNFNFNGANYEAKFTSIGNHNCELTITRSIDSSVIFSETHDRYDLNWLTSHPNYINLTAQRKWYIELVYKEINPKVYSNLIAENNSESIKFGSIGFFNDKEMICKAIVEMLYRLRCILFHGELVPNDDAQKVYEHAYFILKAVVDKL